MPYKEKTEIIKNIIKKTIDDISSRQTSDQKCQNTERIANIRGILGNSKTGKALLDWADKNDIRILMDDQLPLSYEALYLIGTDIILLSAHSNEAASASFLAHELRHAWQDSKEWFSFFLKPTNSAHDLTMPLLLLEADAFVHQIQVTAELYLEGIEKPWLEIEEPSLQANAMYGESFKNYRDSALDDVKNIHNGRAMLECFDGWFKSNAKQFYTNQREEQILNNLTNEFVYLNDENITISMETKSPSAHKIDKANYSHFYNILHDNKSEALDFKNKKYMTSLFEKMDGGSYLASEINDDYLQLSMFEINFSSEFCSAFPDIQERHNAALKKYINHPIHHKPHKKNSPKF